MNNTTLGIIALLFGGLGVHKFIQGHYGMGFLYLFFCRTYIPAIVSIFDAIALFTKK